MVFPFSVDTPLLPQFSPSMCIDEDWLISPMPVAERGSVSPVLEGRGSVLQDVLTGTRPPQEPETYITQELVTENP